MTLVAYRSLPAEHAWRAAAVALFRDFITEQGRRDPLYGWDGGDDDALRRTWGGWDTLHLLVDDGRPIGLVSWADHSSRLGTICVSPLHRAITLTNLYLTPDVRGTGRGAQLLARVRARLASAPPPIALAGEVLPANRLLAATHGWNTAAQRSFTTDGWTTELVEWARPASALRRAPTHLDVRDSDPQTTRLPLVASWFGTAYGLRASDRASTRANEATLSVTRKGRPLLRACFHWTALQRGPRFLVRCTELHAVPHALRDPRVIDALHGGLLDRLGGPALAGVQGLRLPVLLPSAAQGLAAELRAQGLERELLHYATPLSQPVLA